MERLGPTGTSSTYPEVDAALLFPDSATRRIDKAIARLGLDGAEEHLVEALTQARDDVVDVRRKLMQGTLFAVPKAPALPVAAGGTERRRDPPASRRVRVALAATRLRAC
ncbi:MAG: hypothetical protein M5T61_20320 [Acidimicrobiia bacterium]|nr:hypothetical protein [Acidimicrobiia bacterium]